jgi:hypothetical protein
MIRQPRPTAVLVIAIINFVFAGLLLVQELCGGFSLLIMPLFKNMPTVPGQPNVYAEMMRLYDSIPGFYALTIYNIIAGVVFGILLIVASIGLLRLRPWGRRCCIGLAVYGILAVTAWHVYQFVVVRPATERWMAEYVEKMGPQMGPMMSMMNVAGGVGVVFMVLTVLLLVGYGVTVLVILFLSNVKAAFLPGSPYRARYDADREELEDEPAGGDRPSAEDDRFEAGPER